MVALVSSARRLQRSRAGTGEQQCAMRAGKAPVSFIFLSHHSRDDAAACTLRDWLQKEGHAAVFLDHDTEAGIAGGEPCEERLYTELRRCRALIALVGPAPVLRRVQSIDWDHSEEAHERLRRGLLTAGLDPRNSFVLRDDRPPYPGLATFQREDAAVYFGREQEITDLLALLRECRAPSRPRLVLVQGASGTGKSSLLRAGVLPRLERDPGNWLVVAPFRPLRDPFQGLTDALAMATGATQRVLSPATSNLTDPANQAALATWIVDV